MADAILIHLDADDIIARIRAEMEEVIGLIRRPCPSGTIPAIRVPPPVAVTAPQAFVHDQA